MGHWKGVEAFRNLARSIARQAVAGVDLRHRVGRKTLARLAAAVRWRREDEARRAMDEIKERRAGARGRFNSGPALWSCAVHAHGGARWARELLSLGADPCAPWRGQLALSELARHPSSGAVEAKVRVQMLRDLVDAGADVNAKDKKKGWSALHWAAACGAEDVGLALIHAGADVNALDGCGATPLSMVARENPQGGKGLAAALLEAGADPELGWSRGSSAMMSWIEDGQSELVEQAFEAGASGMELLRPLSNGSTWIENQIEGLVGTRSQSRREWALRSRDRALAWEQKEALRSACAESSEAALGKAHDEGDGAARANDEMAAGAAPVRARRKSL
jgi:hypothetical protein